MAGDERSTTQCLVNSVDHHPPSIALPSPCRRLGLGRWNDHCLQSSSSAVIVHSVIASRVKPHVIMFFPALLLFPSFPSFFVPSFRTAYSSSYEERHSNKHDTTRIRFLSLLPFPPTDFVSVLCCPLLAACTFGRGQHKMRADSTSPNSRLPRELCQKSV